MRPITKLFAVSCLLLAVLTIGCGKCKVRGTVKFADGTPLTGGVVNFTDDEKLFKGEINNDGTFEMKTVKPGDGIDPGTYKVYLTETLNLVISDKKAKTSSLDGDGSTEMDVIGKSELTVDPKYSDASTSGLTVTVSKSMKYDITLE